MRFENFLNFSKIFIPNEPWCESAAAFGTALGSARGEAAGMAGLGS
jgi:hypothetical protein